MSINERIEREKVKIAVIGGGAFGTAMCTMAARAGHEVFLYVRDEKQAEIIKNKRINPKYLSEFILNDLINVSTNLNEVLNGALLIILSIPAQTVILYYYLLSFIHFYLSFILSLFLTTFILSFLLSFILSLLITLLFITLFFTNNFIFIGSIMVRRTS